MRAVVAVDGKTASSNTYSLQPVAAHRNRGGETMPKLPLKEINRRYKDDLSGRIITDSYLANTLEGERCIKCKRYFVPGERARILECDGTIERAACTNYKACQRRAEAKGVG